jgi:DNA-directed RNA polymerase specialized sigma24 family protein
MLRCVRHRESLARVRDLRAWLFAVARNEWRRAGGRKRWATALDGPAADALPARADELPGGEEMRGLVARLRPERREVVVLHAWHAHCVR